MRAVRPLSVRLFSVVYLVFLAGALVPAGCGFRGKAPTPAESKAIMDASAKGDAEQVRTAIRANPGVVRARGANGATPLHVAVARGDSAVFQLLLDARSDVNAKKTDGVTPLHIASALGRTAMLRPLLKKGADLYAIDNRGRSPAGFAGERRQTAALGVLTAGDAAMKEGRNVPRQLLGMPVYRGVHLLKHLTGSHTEMYALVTHDEPEKINALYRKRLGSWQSEGYGPMTVYQPVKNQRYGPTIIVTDGPREWKSLVLLVQRQQAPARR